MGVEQLGQRGHARGKPAAADGHQDVIDQRQLLHDLHGDGALARGDAQVVERVDERVAVLLGKFERVLVGLVVDVAGQHHVGAKRLRALNFDERRGGGHYDHGARARVRGGVGHALCVVAGACGDDAAVQLFLAELGDLVVGTAQLVGTCALHVLGLEPHAIAALCGKRGTLHQFGLLGDLLDLCGGLLERLEGEHVCHIHFLLIFARAPPVICL